MRWYLSPHILNLALSTRAIPLQLCCQATPLENATGYAGTAQGDSRGRLPATGDAGHGLQRLLMGLDSDLITHLETNAYFEVIA